MKTSGKPKCEHPNVRPQFEIRDGRPVIVRLVCEDCGAKGADRAE